MCVQSHVAVVGQNRLAADAYGARRCRYAYPSLYDVCSSKEVAMPSGGGGCADAAQGQNEADEMRLNPGSVGRLPKRAKLVFVFAMVPFVVLLVLAFLASR